MEIWKEIEDYEGLYEVSNKGNVRSLDRTIINKNGKEQFYPGKYLKFDKTDHSNTSYLRVTLSKNHKTKRHSVHRLVAFAFLSNNDASKNYVNHINNIGTDNNVSNLEWVTHSENMKHSQKQGRLFDSQSKGGKIGGAVLTAKLHKKHKDNIGNFYGKWELLEDPPVKRKNKYYVKCQCACGTIRLQDQSRMFRNELTDCGLCK